MLTLNERISLLAAGPVFALGLALMQPQILALESLEGTGRFLRSIAAEPDAWLHGHIALLIALALYLIGGLGAARLVTARQAIAGQALRLAFVAAAILLAGNFALDFVYSALSANLPPDAAQAARSALFEDRWLQLFFVQLAPGFFLLAMLITAVCALVAGWLPRMSGVLIIGGWAVVMGLHGAFPYAEVAGHLIVGAAFWLIAFHRPQRADL